MPRAARPPRRPRSGSRGPGSGSPTARPRHPARPRPLGEPPLATHERPELVHLHLAQLQVADEDGGERLGVGGGQPQPAPDRLILVARDLLGRAQAAAPQDDQQRPRHLLGRRLQPVERRPGRRPERAAAAGAHPALPAAHVPIAIRAVYPATRTAGRLGIGWTGHRLTSAPSLLPSPAGVTTAATAGPAFSSR